MKYLFTVFIFLVSIKSFCQHYQLEKPKELKYLDLMVERPSEIPVYAEDYFLPKNLKIKTIIFYNASEEYDINGNILREQKNIELYKTNILYTYDKNILIKKVKTVIGNKEKIKREQEKTEEEIRRNAKNNEIYSTVELETEDKETINTITLDNKNRIISFSYKYFNVKDSKKELKAENSYQVIYKGNQVSEITGNFKSEKYYYTGKLITKKICINLSDTRSSQTETETYTYQYDDKQNLVSISVFKTYSSNKFTQEEKIRVVDSANYDSKNRVIWHGTKNQFTTYKYDKKNNVTESIYSNRNKVDNKKEYEYNNNNEILKISEANFANVKNGNAQVFIKAFIYDKGLLKEIQRSSENILQNKIVYFYDEDKHIIKMSSYNIDKNKKEMLSWEKNYSWRDKTMTIESKYGEPIIYTFF